MARVFSSLLYEGTFGGFGNDLFTVPSGHLFIVRDMRGWNNAPAPAQSDVWIIFDTAGIPLWQLNAAEYVPNQTMTWKGRQIVTAGDTVKGEVFVGNCNLRVSGYDLLLP